VEGVVMHSGEFIVTNSIEVDAPVLWYRYEGDRDWFRWGAISPAQLLILIVAGVVKDHSE
jgi:hypothetical protein